MNGMMKALAETGNDPDNTFVVAGIGCSGKIGTYMHSYALHGVHGRALPVGIGVKMANPNLEVMVAGGDGDGFSIGAGHFIHAVRRNVDMSYVVMDNPHLRPHQGPGLADLARGTSRRRRRPRARRWPRSTPRPSRWPRARRSSPSPSPRTPSATPGFVQEAIEHDGFGFVNVYSPVSRSTTSTRTTTSATRWSTSTRPTTTATTRTTRWTRSARPRPNTWASSTRTRRASPTRSARASRTAWPRFRTAPRGRDGPGPRVLLSYSTSKFSKIVSKPSPRGAAAIGPTRSVSVSVR